MNWDELENALAWFKSAPGEWLASGKQEFSAAAEWIWEVIQGDFSEEQTTAQVITGTVISMIPGVDQICDIRDFVANCKKVNEDTSNKWAWVALCLTLLGCIPEVGSLFKGCFKILIAYGRKAFVRAGKGAFDSNLWKVSEPLVESGIKKLNDFLARPEVRKTIKALKWYNPYKTLATLVRKLSDSLTVAKILAQFDKLIAALRDFVDMIKRWGGRAMGTQAGQLLHLVQNIRNQARAQLAEVLAPVQNWLNRLAKRLELEAEMKYPARTNTLNPHHFRRLSNDAEEMGEFGKKKPGWIDQKSTSDFPGNEIAPHKAGHPDLSESASKPLNGAFKSFHGDINPVSYPEGTVLYRVVDPASADNSHCWMSKAEFEKLLSKDQWRRQFAVKAHWNANGEYVTYTVPPGKTLNAWEGQVASQPYENAASEVEYVLQGGARQAVLDPKDLDPDFMGKRKSTGWGYSNFDEGVDFVGVPVLKNNWLTLEKKN